MLSTRAAAAAAAAGESVVPEAPEEAVGGDVTALNLRIDGLEADVKRAEEEAVAEDEGRRAALAALVRGASPDLPCTPTSPTSSVGSLDRRGEWLLPPPTAEEEAAEAAAAEAKEVAAEEEALSDDGFVDGLGQPEALAEKQEEGDESDDEEAFEIKTPQRPAGGGLEAR